MFNGDSLQNTMEASRIFNEAPKVSEHYILSGKLFNKRELLKRHGVKLWGDYGNVYDKCRELATEMLNYKSHNVWEII